MPKLSADKSLSSASSSSMIDSNKPKGSHSGVNFIEKNKQQLLKPRRIKSTSTSSKNDVAIRCLNDQDQISSFMPSPPEHDDQQVAEISIISSHSSLCGTAATAAVANPIAVVAERDAEVKRASESCDRLRSSLGFESADANNKTETSLNVFESPKLVQGEEIEISDFHHLNGMYKKIYANTTNSDDANIIKFERGKSEIREQLLKRFESNQSKPKEVIMPHILADRDDELMTSKPYQMTSAMTATTTTGLGTISSGSLQSTTASSSSVKLEEDHLTSIAASTIATLNALNQPFARIQSDLESKIASIIGKLEELKESEACIADMLLSEKEKRKRSRSRSQSRVNQNDVDSCFYDHSGLSSMSSGVDDFEVAHKKTNKKPSNNNLNRKKEERLKHLEKVQESQLMSQLLILMSENPKLKQQVSSNEIAEENREPTLRTTTQSAKSRPVRVTSRKKSSKSPSKKTSRGRSPSRRTSGARSGTSSRSQSGCSVCDNEKRRSRSATRSLSGSKSSPDKKKKKKPLLQELLDTNKSPNHSSLFEIANKNALPSHLDDNNVSKPTLFDKYLKEAKELNKKLSEEEAAQEALKRIQTERDAASAIIDEATSSTKRRSSMFGDIKDILKAVEFTKKQIEADAVCAQRERHNKMFYALNSMTPHHSDDERARMRKLVDGCINAISSDVKRIVGQKFIDNSKHVKLEAERDQPLVGSRISRTRATQKPNIAEKKPNVVSEVRKYLIKVYGQDLLNRIKNEELEERNRRAREEAELRKRQLEMEKQLKKQQQQPSLQTQPKNGIAKRPAFVTIHEPFQTYPENRLKSFESLLKDVQSRLQPAPNANATTTVTIIPRSRSTSRDLKKQNLPSIEIKPSSSSRHINTKVVDARANESIDDYRNQSGSGISLRGDGLDYTEELEKFKASLESKTLDWLEREILSYFLNKQSTDDNNDTDEIDAKYSDLLDSIGRTLYVDLGQAVDPNLVEALCYEVLDEKISAMIFNKEAAIAPLKPAAAAAAQPIPSPRGVPRTFDLTDRPVQEVQVPTPAVTPSPPHSPLPGNTRMVENYQQTENNMFQFVKFDDDDESVLDVSIDDDELGLGQGAHLDIINQAVEVPQTPKETPAQSPLPPPETPEPSEQAAPAKHYASTSVQCEPLEPSKPLPPPPPQSEPDVSSDDLTESTSTYTTSDSTLTSSTDNEKTKETSSDSYFSDGAWLMSKSEGQIIPVDETSYINLDMNAAFRGLLPNPMKTTNPTSVAADTNSQSEGEFRIANINPLVYSSSKPRPGLNRIHHGGRLETGELGLVGEMNNLHIHPTKKMNLAQLATQPPRKMSSEGEVENPVEAQKRSLEAQLHDLSIQSTEKKKQPHKHKQHSTSSPKKSSPSRKANNGSSDDRHLTTKSAINTSTNNVNIKPICKKT